MRILVTGGTGFIGRHLCRELDERGHAVTALSRHPEEVDLPPDVTRHEGDVTEFESIAPAFEDRDVVVHLVSLSPLFKPDGGDQRHYDVTLRGTENVVRAAEEHGLSKVVYQSALGADPNASTAYIRAKGRAEAVVRDADVDWTMTRPSIVFGEGSEFLEFTRLLTTPYVTALPGGGRTRFQPIWIGEFAPMLADCVRPEHDGEAYEIGGPEVLTLADVARHIYRAEGKSLRVVPVPMPLAGLALRLVDPLPFVPFGTDQYRSLKFDNSVGQNDVTAFGVNETDLTTLAEYLRGER